MTASLDQDALDRLFMDARTQNGWLEKPVSADLLEAVWDLAKMGPTSANCSPARIVFVVSSKAKESLRPCPNCSPTPMPSPGSRATCP